MKYLAVVLPAVAALLGMEALSAESISANAQKVIEALYKPRVEAMLVYAAVQGAAKGGTATPDKSAQVKKRISAGVAAEFAAGNEFTQRWSASYSKAFTASELQTLEAFLASDVGKKFVALDAETQTTFPEDAVQWFSIIRAREQR
jgi:hypothetical protein